MDIYFEKEIVDVKRVEKSKNYWFVRTFGGDAYFNYLQNNYIGLGFNNVPFEYIKSANNENKDSIKNLTEFIANNTKYTGGEATKWARQLATFQNEVKIGDTVIIPSKNSSRLTIGTITSDTYLEKNPAAFQTKNGIELLPEKRKKVEWEKTLAKEDFQGDLKNLITSHQGITNADNYFEPIEGILSNLYVKEEKVYLIIQINQDEDINAFVLNRFLNSLTYFYQEFCIENGIEVNEELSIKIKLQSKGRMALIGASIVGVVGLSALLLLSNNTEVKADLKAMKVEGKSDGLLNSISDFLDRSQKRKMEYEIFQDSLQRLKVQHKVDSVKLNNEVVIDSDNKTGDNPKEEGKK